MNASSEIHAASWKRELVIAAVLFGFGLLALPFAIYWVGSQMIGEYSPDASPLTLAEQIWTNLLQLEPFAWVLVVSPYVVLQLVRLVRRVWRTRS
jgi:hypothetical protein